MISEQEEREIFKSVLQPTGLKNSFFEGKKLAMCKKAANPKKMVFLQNNKHIFTVSVKKGRLKNV